MRRLRALGKRTPGHSGGAGVPPGGNTTPREELADGRGQAPGQEARPGAENTPPWSAERRPCPLKRGRGTKDYGSASRRSIPSIFEGQTREDGLPGAAKNTGGGAVGCLKNWVRFYPARPRASGAKRRLGAISGDPALKAAWNGIPAFRGYERRAMDLSISTD